MAGSRGSSWEREQRRIAAELERERRAAERARLAAEKERARSRAAERKAEAERKTSELDVRVAALRSVLTVGLQAPGRPHFDDMLRDVDLAPLELGELAEPIVATPWELAEPPDLRGYGASAKPAAGYDKRTMAGDVVGLMDHLGHQRIALIGHDRGARVSTRFAKDHPDRLDRLAILDNIPTRVVAETFDVAKARAGYWFFTFLGVPDLPETLIAGKEEAFLTHFFRSWSYNPELFSAEEIAVYVKAYEQPGAVRGACSDYRAAAEDVAQDAEDVEKLIDCPVLTLWGADSEVIGKAYDVAEIWRGMASDLRAVPIPQCGHLCQEEQPEAVNRELLAFLDGWTG